MPNGGTEPRIFVSPKAGPVFNVDIYRTAGAAAAAEDLIFVLRPANYRIRGQLMTHRKANVVVVLEQVVSAFVRESKPHSLASASRGLPGLGPFARIASEGVGTRVISYFESRGSAEIPHEH